MLVCRKDKWVYVGIPKTGSRAARDGLTQAGQTGVEEILGLHGIPNKLPAWLTGDFTWFVSIRNPFTRALSWYFHKRYWSLIVQDLPRSVSRIPVKASIGRWQQPQYQRSQLGPQPLVWANKSFAECLAAGGAITANMREGLSLEMYRRRIPKQKIQFLRQEQLEKDLQAARSDFSDIQVGRIPGHYSHPYSPYSASQWQRYYADQTTVDRLVKLLRPDFDWLSQFYPEEITHA